MFSLFRLDGVEKDRSAAQACALSLWWHLQAAVLSKVAEPFSRGNPEATARVIEGLITGMGFIGGGAILRLKDSVRGTATAASLWATGAIGTSVGLGAHDIAVVLSVVTIVTLRVLTPLKRSPRDERDERADPGD